MSPERLNGHAEQPNALAVRSSPRGFDRIALLSSARSYEVWDVWDRSRAARAILKSIKDAAPNPDHASRRLIVEGKLLGQLAHPHIVRAYETVTEPQVAIVMETLSGATLSHVIDEEEPLDAGEIAHLGLQVASALAYLHAAGWLHLDLKPSNVIAEAGRAKLIDLGLASAPGRVRAGTGTWSYLAPEQAAGGKVTAATDIWGLGALMFDCVFGHPPFDDPDHPEDARGRDADGSGSEGTARFPQLDRQARSCLNAARTDAGLAAVIDACLSPEPALRPELATVAAALESIAQIPPGERRFAESIASLGHP